jgi:hypothetical protein
VPSELLLPAGVERPVAGEHGMVVNETELPDTVVQQAIETHFEEHASLLGVSSSTTFSTYAHEGSLLARSKFRTPANVIDEVILARDMAERDDDVAACLGAMLAIAFGEGMQNTHEDEMTVAIFDEIAKNADLDAVLCELYRELLIAGAVTSVSLFTAEQFTFRPPAGERQRTRPIVAPLVGVLPAEHIRVVDSDIVNTGTLAYKPPTSAQEQWLEEFFAPQTSPARKAEMRRQDPVLTRMVIERLQVEDDPGSFMATESADANFGQTLYRLNPRMVFRSTFPKGAAKYPRPLLTRNFGLLEAKRLLNLMDYALLQGGSNFLVVAKKGSDLRPAMPEEIRNLRETVRRSSATGVLVGDHRLQIEIITPDLNELLNPAKRRLLGRKIAMALLRLPEVAEADAGAGQAVLADVEILSRVIAADRRLVKRHVENRVYTEAAKRNDLLLKGPASIWFPKIILQGSQYFTDLVLKLRDRGDIPRKFAVEAGGFNYEAAVQQRKREKAAGDDKVMTPAAVPFSSPNAGPQDNNTGRPKGTSPNNGTGAPGTQRSGPATARPSPTITRNSGETVKAIFADEQTVRIGELTHAILEQYADSEQVGRITAFERAAIEAITAGDYEVRREGPLTIVPVNEDHELVDFKAIRLTAGLSMIVGARPDDDAVIARALCFRAPEFSALDAQETAMRWGFPTDALYEQPLAREPRPEPAPEEVAAAPAPIIHVHTGERTRRVVTRDEHGNIASIDDVPAE